MIDPTIEAFLEFGVAGLMGFLWVWERAYSRRRERQLNDAHERIVERDEKLSVLIGLVRRNTAALVQFQQTQRHLIDVLESLAKANEHRRAG